MGRAYHISALYVVDLQKFRLISAGDRLRGQYQVTLRMIHTLKIECLLLELIVIQSIVELIHSYNFNVVLKSDASGIVSANKYINFPYFHKIFRSPFKKVGIYRQTHTLIIGIYLASTTTRTKQFQGLSQDPNSLANLDQDLPNNMIHHVPIFSLPQEWLWCETWCSDASKANAKTIDLVSCNSQGGSTFFCQVENFFGKKYVKTQKITLFKTFFISFSFFLLSCFEKRQKQKQIKVSYVSFFSFFQVEFFLQQSSVLATLTN